MFAGEFHGLGDPVNELRFGDFLAQVPFVDFEVADFFVFGCVGRGWSEG